MNHDPVNLPVILLYNLDRSWPTADVEEILNMVQDLATGLSTAGHPTQAVCLEDDRLEQVMNGWDPARQIVFNWCEEIPGIPSSGALVVSKLEELGFTYTGADSHTLQFIQDKPAVKTQLMKKQIPIPNWKVYEETGNLEWDRFPAIVKLAYEHSSFGITRRAVVHDQSELLLQANRMIEEFIQPILVEDFIGGREFHVSVVGDGRLHVFPIAEMDFSSIQDPSARLCTYDSKFTPESSDYQMIQLRLPAALTSEEKRQLEETAISAYWATNCRDYARLDIRQRDGTFYVLDINPNADLSPDTSLALSAGLAGYSYGQFGSHLVKLAAHRHPVFASGKNRQIQPGPFLAPEVS